MKATKSWMRERVVRERERKKEGDATARSTAGAKLATQITN
jgi:hypothetical protein